jgi:periplasmic protein CpxP/Spy
MSNKLTTALITAGLTSVLALVSIPSIAAQHNGPQGEMTHEMQKHSGDHGQKSAARMERRMTELKTSLKLQESQMNAWAVFESAMKPPMKEKTQTRQEHQEAFKSMTTPQRLDWMQAMKTEREAKMTQRTEAIKTFYGQLNPDQKQSFDQAFWSRHGDQGMNHKGHHNGQEQGSKKMH